MPLRDYQTEDCLSVGQNYLQGDRRQLGVAATGTGKTQLLAHLSSTVKSSLGVDLGRQLLIVDRDELAQQAHDKFSKANPGMSIGVEKASERHNPLFNDLVIASRQTIHSTKVDENGKPIFSHRIKSIDPNNFKTIYYDEAHGVLGSGSINILQYLGVYKEEEEYNDPNKLLLGVTATPYRSDNKGLDKIFSKIVFNRDLRWAIENKWLCDIESYRVTTHVDISDVKVKSGDFDPKQLNNKINTPERNKIIVEKYIEIAGGKKGVFFTAGVEHAHNLAEIFNTYGIKASAVSGKSRDRAEILKSHKAGEITALMNAMLIIFGYDDPTIEVVGICRPIIKRGPLYPQMVGRGERPFPSPEDLAAMLAAGISPSWIKQTCIVIDYVDVTSRHSLITAPTLFGLNPNLDLKGEKAVEKLNEMEEIVKKLSQSKQSLVNLSLLESIDNLQASIERVDLLSVPQTPDEIKKLSELTWHSSGQNYQLSLPSSTFSLRPNTLGKLDCYEIIKGMATYKGTFDDLDNAVKKVERLIPEADYHFAKANSRWRKEPPTQPQLELIAKMDHSRARQFPNKVAFMDYLRENMTKGDASSLISSLLSKR